MQREEAQPLGDIIELREAIACLQFQNDELEEFARVLAYDLHAPLRHINNLSNMVLLDDNSQLSTRANDLMGKLIQQNAGMMRLIKTLRAISSPSPEKVELKYVDLNSLIEEICTQYAKQIAHDNVAFAIEPLPSLSCNAEWTWQLFDNLIRNALTFGGTSTQIRIWGQIISDVSIIYFETTTTQNQQLTPPNLCGQTSTSGSTGLELMLCKKIAELQGGCMSTTLGDGVFHAKIVFKERKNA